MKQKICTYKLAYQKENYYNIKNYWTMADLSGFYFHNYDITLLGDVLRETKYRVNCMGW